MREQSLYFDWTNAGFAFCFVGASAVLSLDVTAPRYPRVWIEVSLDGEQPKPYELEAGRIELPLDVAYGRHTVTVRKRSEIGIGTVALVAAEIDGCLSAAPARAARHIELIGDSLVCGHGNLSTDAKAPFDTLYEGGTQTFGVLAAQQLGAECTVVGRSGLGLVANYDGRRRFTMSNTYLQTAFWDGINDPWDFAQHSVDACVVSLGTNDWVAKVAPPEFEQAAIAFIGTLRQTHPKAHIVWCYGWIESSMQSLICRAIEGSGDENISYLPFEPVTDGTMLGCGHPNVAVHREGANRLAEHLKQYLK